MLMRGASNRCIPSSVQSACSLVRQSGADRASCLSAGAVDLSPRVPGAMGDRDELRQHLAGFLVGIMAVMGTRKMKPGSHADFIALVGQEADTDRYLELDLVCRLPILP